ncbi:FadR family transcriptional regulator [Akkermansiaceae bacterium]|nr:FadR family transcriptional regulator [Akkermansiaceae bacterium]MDB4569735.1 FadR family transcriptional regulator [Akkermansiaceae bacterium]MDB4771227.1 FadR family transcriptional regulator [Akkermansiaceae bacterium]
MAHRSSEIVRELEVEIMDGRLLTGQRLPSEEKLCSRFKVSRTVIREAIQQLRGRGLIRTLKGSGSYIADPSLDTLADALEAYSVLSSSDSYLELVDFRILLETECARLAALNAGERMIETMELAQTKMENSRGDRARFSSADIAFHLAIAAGSKHNLYATVLSALEKPSIEYANKNRGDAPWYGSVIDTHKEILRAIKDGKSDEAATAMKRHLILSRRHYVDLEIE